MKKLFALLLLAACGFEPVGEAPVDAGVPVAPPPVVTLVLPRGQWTQSRTVKDVTTPISLQLDETRVFCTWLGYGGEAFLKVSIPQLDSLARFDHRVEGTSLPCAAVGVCTADVNAETILQGNPGFEPVDLRVVLTQTLFFDGDAETCQRQLSEDVSAQVRGVPIQHHVEGPLEPAPLSDCTGR